MNSQQKNFRELVFLPFVFITIWYVFNLSTLILNKYLFQILQFKYPFTLTAVHMMMSFIGAALFLRVFPQFIETNQKPDEKDVGLWEQIKGYLTFFKYKKVDDEGYWYRVFPLSFLFILNIVLGNISLKYVPVSFMQTVKSSVPAMNVFIQFLVMGKRFSVKTQISVALIVVGVAASTLREVNFNFIGFACALGGSLTTAIQALLIGQILSGQHSLDSMNLIYYMAPLSFLILMPFCLFYEIGPIFTEWVFFQPSLQQPWKCLTGLALLALSGFIAFALNISSFLVVRYTSALTYNVAGNFKVILSILLSVLIFKNEIDIVNGLGCILAVGGAWMYSNIRLQENAAEKAAKEQAASLIHLNNNNLLNNNLHEAPQGSSEKAPSGDVKEIQIVIDKKL